VSLKNVTFSADPKLIDAARTRAEAEQTTLNELFRRWLADYVGRQGQAESAMAFVRELQTRYSTGGRKYSREELNER
jgi:hypothetical protein